MQDLFTFVRTPTTERKYGGDASGSTSQLPLAEQDVMRSGASRTTQALQHQSYFMQQARPVEDHLAKIETLKQDFRSLYDKSKVAIRSDELQQYKNQMEGKIAQGNREVAAIKQLIKKLGDLRKDIVMNHYDEGVGPGTKYEEMTRKMIEGFNGKLQNLMNGFLTLREEVNEDERASVARRVYIATGENIPEQQLDTLMHEGGADRVYQMVMEQRGRQVALQVLDQVNQGHEQAKRLEQSLLQLLQMFQDMATLVAEQSQVITEINEKVERAAVHIEQGVKDLDAAAVIDGNIKRRKLMIGAAVAVVILIIIIVIVVVSRNKGPSGSPPPSGRRMLLQQLLLEHTGADLGEAAWLH